MPDVMSFNEREMAKYVMMYGNFCRIELDGAVMVSQSYVNGDEKPYVECGPVGTVFGIRGVQILIKWDDVVYFGAHRYGSDEQYMCLTIRTEAIRLEYSVLAAK